MVDVDRQRASSKCNNVGASITNLVMIVRLGASEDQVGSMRNPHPRLTRTGTYPFATAS